MDSNSVKLNKFKKFLDEESILYKLEFSDTSLYLLLCNINQSFAKEILSALQRRTDKELNFQKLSEEVEGEGDGDNPEKKIIYSFQDLNQKFSNGLNLPSFVNQQIIKEISKDQWKDKYVHLIYKDEEFLIKSYEDQDYTDKSQIILGVFLTEKDKIFSFLESENDMILNDFKEELKEKVSDLFYYDEDEEINQSGDQDQEYKRVKRNDEENFDKEFDYLDENAEEEDFNSQPRSKINKQSMRNHSEHSAVDEGNRKLNISKSPEKKKRRRKEIDESEFRDDVIAFMAKMREAIELDNQSFEDNKPALEKLKLLPQIEKFLGNIYFQRTFLQSEGLALLQEWIQKCPDDTFAPLNQISSMLDIISNLSLSLPYLRSCQIGGHIMEISKNPKMSKPLQKKARDIVEKWSRIVWDINTNYSDIDSENRTYESIYRKKRRHGDDEEDSNDEESQPRQAKKENLNDIYSHAKIPKKALFDFTQKPIGNVSDNKQGEIRIRHNLFDKRNKGGRKND